MRERTRLKLLGFLLAWAVALAACASFAQPAVTRGGALKKRAYQTYGAMTLYVDPTGSDSNACTASGTSACATLAGARAKVPTHVRHDVTVTVAAGSFSEPCIFNDLDIAKDVTVTVQGTTTPFVPATGSASGSVTSFSAWSGTTPAVLTDSTQSWTTNNLRAAWLYITSGAQAGLYFPIVSNTATTLTAPLTSALTAGTTYEIVTMGSVFTGTSSFAYAASGVGTLRFKSVRMEKASTLWGNPSNTTPSALVECQSCDLRVTSGNALSISGGTVRLLRSHFAATGSSAVVAFLGTGALSTNSTNNFVEATAGLGVSSTSPSYLLLNGWVVHVAGNNTTALSLAATPRVGLATVSIECTGTGQTGVGSAGLSPAAIGVTGIGIKGCATGVSVAFQTTWVGTGAMTVDTATTAFSATSGGRISFGAQTPTFTGVTDELQLDGTSYTYSFLSGLSPGVIIGPYGSAIYK